MMHGKLSSTYLMIICFCGAAASAGLARDTQAVTLQADSAASAVGLPMRASDAPGSLSPENSVVKLLGGEGRVAADPPGITVYHNEITPEPGELLLVWKPGASERMAEDLQLVAGGCNAAYYNLSVAGFGDSGLTFDVHVSLWDGDPCEVGSAMIPGTEADVLAVPNNGYAHLLEITLGEPVAVPEIVWLEATFSTVDSGWVVAEQAELGYTRDLFSENDLQQGCVKLYLGGNPYAGFWANVNCELPYDPTGACCDGTSCTEVAEATCTSGTWLGAFSTCDPSPCLTGACCTDDNYGTCVDTTKAECAGMRGFFRASTTCASTPCQRQFHVYRNDRDVAGHYANVSGTLLADDQVMAAGAPCALASFDLDTYAPGFAGSYDVTVELWTVDDQTSLPDAPIPGAAATFSSVEDGAYQSLLAGPFTGITLPDRIWMVISTSTDQSGWLIRQEPTLGQTLDVFGVYQNSSWGAFDFPDYWSGFGANIRCYGVAPTGACCADAAGTCIDGMIKSHCGGRWLAGATCDPDPFDPPCGTGACCTIFGCANKTPEECAALDGEMSPLGTYCNDITCPRTACIGAAGDCLSAHGTPGCEDGFCCEKVCAVDDGCCQHEWDSVCVDEADRLCLPPPPNDNCAEAEAISGEGLFDFDNTAATTDGPPHDICSVIEGDEQTIHDVWYCWTASCSEPVYVQTCGLTGVDTKMNVYAGCDTCPPNDAIMRKCNDDFCGFDPDVALQSQVSFMATAGQGYLFRVGTFPGGTDPDSGPMDPAEGGSGRFKVSCGIPSNPACPGGGDCYSGGGTGTAGCAQEDCCNKVCACDAYCCDVEWDANCATTGFDNSGCGAAILCEGPTCPSGEVRFIEPPDGVVDARQPYPPGDSGDRQGIAAVLVEAPAGADNTDCWTVCETAVDGVPNTVRAVTDNGDGTMTVGLVRSISTGAVTTITYTNDIEESFTLTLTSHPANVNADTQASPPDILQVIDYLNGVATSPWGIYSEDVDRSGLLGPPDILRVIDLLNGAGQFDSWLNTPLPTSGTQCP